MCVVRVVVVVVVVVVVFGGGGVCVSLSVWVVSCGDIGVCIVCEYVCVAWFLVLLT
jgi:hypothetical protein